MDSKDKKVFVGLSGGVDSAVSAALLKQQGAEVTGVFVKGWYPPGMPCTWSEDRRDAMRVAARLRIPFRTLDASKEYKEGVIDYLLREYAAGRTPNPDVMCNREVKFGALARFARSEGAAYLATGHYARLDRDASEGLHLCRGASVSKDQSYFLWAVPKTALEGVLFPIGGYEKSRVRELARGFDLPVAAKKDSQGVCFLGSVSVDEFLKAELGTSPGKAFDEEGKEIGRHDGVLLYTLGEGVGLTSGLPGPWYVVGKRVRENELMVSRKLVPEKNVPLEKVALLETSWLQEPSGPLHAQYRYHGASVRGRVEEEASGYSFFSDEPFPEYPAAGQSLVLYRGEELVGGGIISL